MTENQIKLIEPTEKLRESFAKLIKEFHLAGETDKLDGSSWNDDDTFTAYLHRVKDFAKGENLPDGWIPCSTYWLVSNNIILGLTGLRHHLTENLKDFGGHIGYSIRPSERNKGYGSLILKLALQKARDKNITRILITCDTNNIPSQKIIKNNGGILHSESFSNQVNRITQRYWINLTP